MAVHVIGLTGGIASGKSTVAKLLAERGAAIVDADQLARQVVEPGQPALAELVSRFGAAILTPDGQLDRKRLGAIAFSDPGARADLGRITHPRIAAASAAAIAAWADAGANVVFYEAALLVENRAHAGLEALVVVAASPDVQLQRIRERDGLSAEDAAARIAAQAPLADKLAAATWVIQNDGDHAALVAEVERVVAEIEARYGAIRVPKAQRDQVTGRSPRLSRDTVLLTGFPAFTAKRMIAKLLADEPAQMTKLYVLAQQKFAADAERYVKQLPGHERAEILVGDVCDMDLGLSSAEYRALSKELTWIHHLAGIYFMGVDDETARRVNVSGTRTVLDLARDTGRLERVVHWSTAMVSGDRKGTWYEEDLEAGQKFHNGYERTKYEAEKLVRAAMRQLPITILRPSIIVGDSKTGEIDKLDGPYYLMVLIATNASGLRLPLLGRGDAPLHLVPIDYVIDAAWHIVRSEGAAGRTFHIVDPSPMTARAVFEAVAEHANTEKPRGHIPRPLARAVLKTPGLSRLSRGPLAFVDVLDHAIHYDQTNTTQALAGTTVRCPALADYLPVLVRHVLDVTKTTPPPRELEVDEDAADPLA
ncbi:MAG TPA: dephospho-CoA kinase [Kofleriaceae bacterium]|nr:dephospho-CoA kinase [Kofleriaceae bacterium]